MQNEITATIQLDKLTLCCTSTIKNNFNDAIKFDTEEAYKFSYSAGNTTLTKTFDYNRRYKYCYSVTHKNNHIGNIKFGLYGQSHLNDKVWFSIHNSVFYNNTLHFLPTIFEHLNLRLHNVTRAEIALDSYVFNFDSHLRKNLRNKENKVKLFGRYIDRKALEKRIRYWNYGSLDNPFKVRTIYIKNKKKVNYPKNEKTILKMKKIQTMIPKTILKMVPKAPSNLLRITSWKK